MRLPFGVSAESVGLQPVIPGFGRVRGSDAIARFAIAHPDLAVEVAPPVRTLLDQVGIWTNATLAHQDGANGDGVLVGVADTGLDVTHPDFQNADGSSRVAWILDLSAQPYGKYPDLEKKYGTVDANGNPLGAVYQGSDFPAIQAAGFPLPGDEVGHGTHVTSLAAGNGGQPPTPLATSGSRPTRRSSSPASRPTAPTRSTTTTSSSGRSSSSTAPTS